MTKDDVRDWPVDKQAKWYGFCAWEEGFWKEHGRYPTQFEVWQAAMDYKRKGE